MQNPPEGEHQQRLRTRREVLAIAALSSEFPVAPPSAEEMFRASAAAARGRLQEAALLNNLAASSTSRTAAVLLNSLALGSPGESPESGEYQSGSDDDEPLRARAVRNGDGASPLVQRQPSPRTGAPGRRRGQAPSPLAAAVG